MYSPPNSMFLIHDSCIESSPNAPGAAEAPADGAVPDDPPPAGGQGETCGTEAAEAQEVAPAGAGGDDGGSNSAMNQSS